MSFRPDTLACWQAANRITSSNASFEEYSFSSVDVASQKGFITQPPTFSLILCDENDDQRLENTLSSLLRNDLVTTQVVLAGSPQRRRELAGVLTKIGAAQSVEVHVATNARTFAELEASALGAARGDFVGFVAAGDVLELNALSLLANVAQHDPAANIIYSDEDWIDDKGLLSNPRLKTGWDPDAHLGRDHFGQLCLLRRSRVEDVGGLRLEHAPAHRYDLHCRVAFSVSPLSIRHVPLILCHRAIPFGADKEDGKVADFRRAGRNVAQAAAQQLCGEPVSVTPAPLAPFINRIHWPLPQQLPFVSILVPTRDRGDLVRNCVEGLLSRTDYDNFEVLILDNDSKEAETFLLFEELSADSRVKVVPVPGSFNFSRINNDGVRAARGEILVFLNNDIEIIGGGWLREMVSNALRPDVGCVGARLLYGDRHIQHAGIVLQPGPLAMHVFRRRQENDVGFDAQLAGNRTYAAVTAACLVMRRSIFERVRGFDEHDLQVSFQDVDLCLKVEEVGYRNLCTPFEPLLHLEGSSRNTATTPEKQARERRELECLMHRWNDRFHDDKFGHPLIRLDWENPERIIALSHGASVLDLVR